MTSIQVHDSNLQCVINTLLRMIDVSADSEILTKLKINHFQPDNSRTEALHSSQSFFICRIPWKVKNVHQGFTSYIEYIWTCTVKNTHCMFEKKHFDCYRDPERSCLSFFLPGTCWKDPLGGAFHLKASCYNTHTRRWWLCPSLYF